MSVGPKGSLSVKKEKVNLRSKQHKRSTSKPSLYHRSQTPAQKQMDYFKASIKPEIDISELESLHKTKMTIPLLENFHLKTPAVHHAVNVLSLVFLCLPGKNFLVLRAVEPVSAQPVRHPSVTLRGWEQSQTQLPNISNPR